MTEATNAIDGRAYADTERSQESDESGPVWYVAYASDAYAAAQLEVLRSYPDARVRVTEDTVYPHETLLYTERTECPPGRKLFTSRHLRKLKLAAAGPKADAMLARNRERGFAPPRGAEIAQNVIALVPPERDASPFRQWREATRTIAVHWLHHDLRGRTETLSRPRVVNHAWQLAHRRKKLAALRSRIGYA